MARVLFGMINNMASPIGGVKVIFQTVAALRRRGIDAYVASAAGWPQWLSGSPGLEDAALLDLGRAQTIGPRDLYVATDAIGAHRVPLLLSRPERSVLFVQNHNALRVNTAVDWTGLRHIRCLTVSEYSRRYLTERAGFAEVAVVPPGVDLGVFRPASEKRHRVCYMPRKWPGLAERLRERVRHDVEWLAIDGRPEAETAAILAASSVFLNLGRGEGFGLPALEAMASGCVTCGFAGEGTSDFATPENGFWAGEGDVEGCLAALQAAIMAAADQQAAERLAAAGLATAQRYALPVFGDRMADYFRALL